MSTLLVVFPCIHSICNRFHQKTAPKHIFIVQIAGCLIFLEVHDKWSHHTATVLHHITCRGIDIGQQSITKPDGIYHGIISPVAWFSEVIQFTDHRTTAVVADERHKSTPLHPSCLQFLNGRILRVLFELPIKEPAQVCVPEGNTTEWIIQSRRYLLLHL